MPTPTPTELLAFLQENGFLSPSQVQQFLGDGITKYADSQALARDLIQQELLTPYQANQLLQGKGNDLLLGPYLLVERLGAGGMGQVFKARHIKMNREVALKIIPKEQVSNPTAVSRFYREAQAVAKLSHPNIVAAFDINAEGQTHYLAMELVDGIDLARLVRQSGPLAIPQACEFIRQAAIGLQHAHENGLVHRDIKPGNLMVARSSSSKTPVIKILDFGVARFESDSERATRLTQLGHVIGTADYMAPEQAQNSRMVDIRADIYSLGCSLFYLLTGKPPFPGDSAVERLSARVLGNVPSVRKSRHEIPPVLDQVLAKMTARDPLERYQTPGGVAKSLASFTKSSSKLDAKAMTAPADSVSCPARGTKIHAETNEIKEVLREAPGKTSPKAAQGKAEADPPPADLTDTSAASERIVRASEEAKPYLAPWWKRPGMFATAVGVSLALILTAVTVNWVKEQFANRARGAQDPATHDSPTSKDGFADDTRPIEPKRGETSPFTNELTPKQKDSAKRTKESSKDSGTSSNQKPQSPDLSPDMKKEPSIDPGTLREPPKPQIPDLPPDVKNDIKDSNSRPKEVSGKQDEAQAHYKHGIDLLEQKNAEEAIAEFRQAIQLRKNFPEAHCYLGIALRDKGKQEEEAIFHFREAIKLKYDYHSAHCNLSLALLDKKDFDGARYEAEWAIKFDKKNPCNLAHFTLGSALEAKSKWDKAIEAYRNFIQLNADEAAPHTKERRDAIAAAHTKLAAILDTSKGNRVGAIAEYCQAFRLNPNLAEDRKHQQPFLQHLIELLPRILNGKTPPDDPSERLLLAELCRVNKQRYRLAAQLADGAFKDKPSLVSDLTAEYQYYAACAAAQAGCARGQDPGRLDEKEQAHWRNKALEWLRADLELRRKQLNEADAKTISLGRKKLEYWQTDPDLACVRDKEWLAERPEAERREWRKLWEEVECVLKPAPVGDANRKNEE